MNKNFYLLIVIVTAAIGGFVFLKAGNKQVGHLDEFAKCLVGKGITMYGADWCPHCQNEKEAFGSSFRYINYVECTQNPKACTDARIMGYPTWIAPDVRLEGEQGVAKLAEISGCSLLANP